MTIDEIIVVFKEKNWKFAKHRFKEHAFQKS